MRDAIRNRVSRRTFTGVPFTESEKEAIISLVEKANTESGLSIEYVEDGGEAFASRRKSYGMFKNVRSLLLMKGKKSDANLWEKVGYYGEGIILDLTDMDFGTCWVGGTFDKSKFDAQKDEEITSVIVIGKIDPAGLKERMIRSAISKRRKPVEERLISEVEIPEWMRQGMESVRLAPSAVNSQKPTFHYDGEVLTADVSTEHAMYLIDLGIAKKHFEEAAPGRFELGQGGRLKMDSCSEHRYIMRTQKKEQ